MAGFWRPTCPEAGLIDNFVYRCQYHDPVLPADCAGCRQRGSHNEEEVILMRRKDSEPGASRVSASKKLEEMGYIKAPDALFARLGRAGKYLRVAGAGPRGAPPQRLTFSAELVMAAGVDRGDTLQVYYKGDSLAFVPGDGPLTLTKNGSKGLAVNCPLLLSKVGLTEPGAQLAADVTDGIIIASLKKS